MDTKNYSEEIFEKLKHVNGYGQEFWYARELQVALEYSQWRYLKEAIERAKTACTNSGQNMTDHFAEVRKMVEIGSNAKREREIKVCPCFSGGIALPLKTNLQRCKS